MRLRDTPATDGFAMSPMFGCSTTEARDEGQFSRSPFAAPGSGVSFLRTTSKETAMPKRLLWVILFSCLPALILAQAPKKDRLTLDLYLELESVADPQLSPDGSQIIYTRGGVDKVNDKRETSLWIMNADGSRNRFLVQASEPRWSPNGCRT